MPSRSPCACVLRAIVGAVALSIVAHAQASDHGRVAPSDPAWQNECGSCHVAYPPRLLPAPSWQAIMLGLDQHFGTDATVDAATGRAITAFLEANAGRSRVADGAVPLRITQTAWFRRKHDEVPPGAWRSAQVKSAANCGACHPQAASGRYGEHDVRIPR